MQNRLQLGQEIFHLGLAMLALDEVIDHAAAEWTRSIQGHQGDHILEHTRFELAQDIAQPLALKLKNAEGAGVAEQLIGLAHRQAEYLPE